MVTFELMTLMNLVTDAEDTTCEDNNILISPLPFLSLSVFPNPPTNALKERLATFSSLLSGIQTLIALGLYFQMNSWQLEAEILIMIG